MGKILQTKQITDLVNKHYPSIFTQNEIPANVLMGQIIQESSGNTEAFLNDRNGGSYGLMQVDKFNLETTGFPSNTNLYDPDENIKVGFTLMKMNYYGENGNPDILNITDKTMRVAMTLVTYNCGAGNFEEMYQNHLSANVNGSWNDWIKNQDLISNWINCIEYPALVFYKSGKYFNLEVEDRGIFYNKILLPNLSL